MSFMEPSLLRTTVIGSYPFPSWLHHAVDHWDVFGSADQQEIIEDAVIVAIMDQIAAGLDVITDGEQTRLDFNLSFYGFLEGISLESASPRKTSRRAGIFLCINPVYQTKHVCRSSR